MKLFQYFRIQTDDHLLEITSATALLEKKETWCCMTYLLCPFDTRVQKKEQEKMEHCQDLSLEVQRRIWGG